nr:hypothetical protein [Amylibacter sp.]
MSETGRKMDVEDVLSSIRRLVSEEARSVHDTPKPAASPKTTVADVIQRPEAKGPEKLVLTPSLRVPEALSATPAAAEIEQRIADIESLVMSEAVESTKAEIARSVEVQDHDTHDHGNASDYDDSDDGAETGAAPQDHAARMAEMVEDDAYDDDDAPEAFFNPVDTRVDAPRTSTNQAERDEAADMMSALHLSMRDFAREEPPLTANLSKAPQLVEPVADSSDDENHSETDGEPGADLDTPVDELMAGLVNFDFVETETDDDAPRDETNDGADAEDKGQNAAPNWPEADAEFPADSPFQEVVDEDEPAEAVSAKETVIDREPVQTAPPAAAATSAQQTAEHVTEQDRPAPSNALFDEPIDYTDGDDGFLDEESLREMVSDMVRSELQGELGDRITRNVRKLVRREIYRALASREFE